MTNKLSIVTTGRDDDYEHDFLDRLHCSLVSNITELENQGIEYEYVVVEWNPFRPYLSTHKDFKPLFDNFKGLRNLIVDRSVVEAEGLPNDKYFEYFAKNAGLRNSVNPNILVLNSDIVMPCFLVAKIKELLDKGLDKDKFYRTRFRQKMNLGDYEPYETTDLHNPSFADACICGGYSGDFLLVNRETLFNVGRGYDEVHPGHRRTFQTGMDGEILWNMYLRGVSLEFVNEPYIHLQHGKSRAYDCYNSGVTYENKPDWGFVKYNIKKVSDKAEVIYA